MFFEAVWIQKHLQPFLRALNEVMVAAGAHPKILLQFQIVDQLRASRAFLPEAGGQLALLV
jgi:hypothetical protein